MTASNPLSDTFADAVAPPKRPSISEWAESDRELTAEEGCPIPGPYRYHRAPLLREITDALSSDDPAEYVAVMKSVQFGLSDVANNWIGHSIRHDPTSILMVQCNEEHQRNMIGLRLARMFDVTPGLAQRVGKQPDSQGRKKRGVDAATRKTFPGGYLIVGNARSAPSLGMMSAQRLILDETDRYPFDIGGQGEPCEVAEGRTTNHPHTRKIFLLSSPTVSGLSRIEHWWNQGDKRLWFVTCPECGELKTLAWNRKQSRVYKDQPCFEVVWSELGRPPEEAALRCDGCGHVVEDHERAALIAGGEWIPTADSKIKSYHVSALYSTLGLSLGQLAEQFLRAKRKKSPEGLKTFIQERLGEPWLEGEEDKIDESELMARRHSWWQPPKAEDGPGVPIGVCLLTAGVDAQRSPPRLEVDVYGWGPGEEHWSIDRRVIYGDPRDEDVWDHLAEYLRRSFPCEAGGSKRIVATCVDTGWPTEHAYRFVRSCPKRRLRHVYAVKGKPGRKSPQREPVWPRRPKKISRKLGGGVRYNVGTDSAKDVIDRWLRVANHGPGFGHRDFRWDDGDFRQLTAEYRATEHKNGYPIRFWKRRKKRPNERLDCLVYAYAALCAVMSFGRTIESFGGGRPAKAKQPAKTGDSGARRATKVDGATAGCHAGARKRPARRAVAARRRVVARRRR